MRAFSLVVNDKTVELRLLKRGVNRLWALVMNSGEQTGPPRPFAVDFPRGFLGGIHKLEFDDEVLHRSLTFPRVLLPAAGGGGQARREGGFVLVPNSIPFVSYVAKSIKVNGPMHGPMNGPMNGPMHGPMNGPMNGPNV